MLAKIFCKERRVSFLLLLIAQLMVSLGWFIQFVLHQTWRVTFGGKLSVGMGLTLSVLLALIPLVYVIICLTARRSSLAAFTIRYDDSLIILLLIFLGISCWWYFCGSALYYPMHTYGDEAFHIPRVQLMLSDFWQWWGYLTTHAGQGPDFHAEYMMYPSLAYVPVMTVTALLGNPAVVADQRIALVMYYLIVIVTTYILSRLIIRSKFLSFLLTLLPLSSGLLMSYTVSFYIELPYVGVLLASFCFLTWGISQCSKEWVGVAVFVASIAPIIRETAIAISGVIIVCASVWRYLKCDLHKTYLYRFFFAVGYVVVGLIPFAMYYYAKNNYTSWDKTRTSLAFIFHQDYLSLFSYSFVYLGPLAFLAFLFFVLSPKRAKAQAYLVVTAILSVGVALWMQSIFLPGYMPWSRNYLFYYASCLVLIVAALDYILKHWKKGKIIVCSLLCLGILINFLVDQCCLQDDRIFNESEVVFDLRPIQQYILLHQNQFNQHTIYIDWPQGFVTYPDTLLPDFVHLKKLTKKLPVSNFRSFTDVESQLPIDAQYLLFYYLKVDAKPVAFHSIPSVAYPLPAELKNYRVLVASADPWSAGRNGVLLLERVQSAHSFYGKNHMTNEAGSDH